MINLLPPELKTQIEYSRKNAQLVGLLALVITCLIIIMAAFSGTHLLLSQESKRISSELKDKEQEIKKFSALENESQQLSDRLKAAKTVISSQAKFSSLLSDLANVTPAGTYINSIAFTGDHTKPVRVTATAPSYLEAVSFRDSLARSARVAGADIEDVSNPGTGVYRINLNVTFKAGYTQ